MGRVHVCAHAGAAEGNGYLLGLRLMQRLVHVMDDEVKEAKARGWLRERKVFGIAHAGMAMGFFEYHGGGLQGIELVGWDLSGG